VLRVRVGQATVFNGAIAFDRQVLIAGATVWNVALPESLIYAMGTISFDTLLAHPSVTRNALQGIFVNDVLPYATEDRLASIECTTTNANV